MLNTIWSKTINNNTEEINILVVPYLKKGGVKEIRFSTGSITNRFSDVGFSDSVKGKDFLNAKHGWETILDNFELGILEEILAVVSTYSEKRPKLSGPDLEKWLNERYSHHIRKIRENKTAHIERSNNEGYFHLFD